MRILHVITSLHTGGAEKLMVDLLPRLRDMGNEVEILLFDGTSTPFYNDLVCNGIKIHRLSIGGNVYNPLNIFRLKSYLKKYDIVHTHNTACQYFIAIASILFKCNAKLITTEHSTHNRRRDILGFRYIDRYIYKQYHKIISISQKVDEILQQHIGRNYPCIVIENGVDLSLYQAKIVSPNTDNYDDIIITMVAGFRASKDHDTLIKAVAQLPINYKLRLIGDGERRKDIEQLITTLNLTERITLLGVRNDIPYQLSQSHLVVLSSYWEGFGLSAVEGMAAGKPVLVSNVAGLREVVDSTELIFNVGDYDMLASKIRTICETQEIYYFFAKKCFERSNRYSIKQMAKSYNEIYMNKNMGKHTPLITVILPCFNVGKYVGKCLKSILKQSFQNFEIICIDDCSTDNTIDVLTKYAKSDSRIKIISLPQNMGLANNRRLGVNNANGEYIAYIDPDDYVGDRYLESLYNQTQNSTIDLVILNGCINKWGIITSKHIFDSPEMNFINKTHYNEYKNKILKNFYGLHCIPAPVWGKLYKKTLFTNLPKVTVFYQEDVMLNFYIFTQTLSSLKVANYQGYYYQVGGGTSFRKNYIEDNIVTYTIRRDYIKSVNIEEKTTYLKFLLIELKNIFYEYIVRMLLNNNSNEDILLNINYVLTFDVISDFKTFSEKYFPENLSNEVYVAIIDNDTKKIFEIAKRRISLKRKISNRITRLISK